MILAEEKMVFSPTSFFTVNHILSRVPGMSLYSHGFNVQSIPCLLLYQWLNEVRTVTWDETVKTPFFFSKYP